MGRLTPLAPASEPNLLVLDFECKPGHWIGGDFVSKLMTAGAWAWNDNDEPPGWVSHYDGDLRFMLEVIEEVYVCADIIIGHYERGFDLPLLNGMREREGLSPLEPKLTIDTKLDRLKTLGRSQSQKNLAADYGLTNPKVDITLRQWEDFNDRQPDAEDAVIERCRLDVEQCRSLFRAQRDRGMLGPPRMMDYRPGSGRSYVG